MPQTITVYGFGYVGKAVVRFLKDHYTLQIVDPKPVYNKGDDDLRSIHMVTNPQTALLTKYAVVCVPTQPAEDGSCDTSIVEYTIRAGKHEHYLIKSTIEPGTTARLAKETGQSLVFSPEYMGEGKYEIPYWLGYPHPTDMKKHSFYVFGGPDPSASLWVEIWQKIGGPMARYKICDSTTAEMIKYVENANLATMKIFFDEIYEVCRSHGVNYHKVRDILLEDKRISPAVSLIFPDARGFGGKCLPKDLNALVRTAQKHGYEPEFFNEVLRSNKRFRKE